MINLILAVALSISSTNDYVFTEVVHTNFVGVGMGETFDYSILRNEDRCFLVEAIVERDTIAPLLSSREVVAPPIKKADAWYYPGRNNIPSFQYHSILLERYRDGFSSNYFATASSLPDRRTREVSIDASFPEQSKKYVFSKLDTSRKFPELFSSENYAWLLIETNAPRAIVAGAYTNVYADIAANTKVLFFQPARAKGGYVMTYFSEGSRKDPSLYDEEKGWTYDEGPISQKYDYPNIVGNDEYLQADFSFSVSENVSKRLVTYMRNGSELSRATGIESSRDVYYMTPAEKGCFIRLPKLPYEEVKSVDNAIALISIQRRQTASGKSGSITTRYFVKPVSFTHVDDSPDGCRVFKCDIDMASLLIEGLGMFGWELNNNVEGLIEYPSEAGGASTGYRVASNHASIMYISSLLGFAATATVDFHAKVLKD